MLFNNNVNIRIQKFILKVNKKFKLIKLFIMKDLVQLDKLICKIYNDYEIKSYSELKTKLPKEWVDIGLNWYIHEKYKDLL